MLAVEKLLYNGILNQTYYQQDCLCEVSWLFGECLLYPAYQDVVIRAMFKESADIEGKVGRRPNIQGPNLVSSDKNILSMSRDNRNRKARGIVLWTYSLQADLLDYWQPCMGRDCKGGFGVA